MNGAEQKVISNRQFGGEPLYRAAIEKVYSRVES
jgi:hypothetical protein